MTSRARQSGAALLLFALVFIVGFAALLYARLGSWADASTNKRKLNAQVLQQAKSALIGYVVKEVLDVGEDAPGRFPCPESPTDAGTTNEGRAAGTCAPTFPTNKNVGRLPWRTVGVDKLVDASAEPLWYAVSPNWVFAGASPLINAGTPGQLTFDGTGDVVAVIFAPGPPLRVNPAANQVAAGCVARSQSRADRSHVPAGGNPDFRDYLECQNASSPIDATFGVAIVDNATNEVVNDQAVTITAKEVLNAMQGPLAERLQRTVAPLLSEFGDQWIAGSKFLPYAMAFTQPENGVAQDAHCGPSASLAQQMEGLLPIARSAAPCSSNWTGAFTGDGITSAGCDTASPVACSFSYYRFTPLGQLLLGLTGVGSVTATLQANAPHGAASFRARSVQSTADITVAPPGSATLANFSIAPQTDGDAGMSVQATVSAPNICKDSLLGGLTCNGLLGFLFVTQQTVSLQFPQLGTPMLAGGKLSVGAHNGHAGPFDLLNPVAGDPHYWFIHNEWYRYTYYAVAPSASAAQSAGNITVSGFPSANGNTNDKRFVLALMGPAVTGQTRSPTAALNQYVEGPNAVTGGSPRTFAYQVYASSGNDRIATCPYTDGTTPCD
ncbi:MAG TPA: hypothetical protein VFJ70_14245 [Burkholderiales bacterium]|nr:hypothetical protein [Burkholderiales bacterium]